MTRLRLDGRFNGPPGTANGGYACGSVAALVGAPAATVRLRRPPRVDVDLAAAVDAEGRVLVTDGDELVAEGAPAGSLGGLEPPVVPSLADARAAMRAHFGHGREHALSGCWVCGPRRHDGLGLTFGPLPGRPDVNAAVLLTDPTLPTVGATLAPEAQWAALDCPSYPPAMAGREEAIALLAEMTAELRAPVQHGRPAIALGWSESAEGRKHRTASALVDEAGHVLGRARALWIEVRA